jgi:fatty acid desaturase
LNHPRPHRFPISKAAFWRRYVLSNLWPPTILGYLFGRAKSANMDNRDSSVALRVVYRPRVARCLRGAYWLLILSCVHATNGWTVFGLFWIVPLLTVYPLLMQFREIAHHSNAPDTGDLTNSRVFQIHPMLAAAIFPYGQAFHLTHHLFARIPHYRLPEAHALLGRFSAYRESVVICHGYFFRGRGNPGPSVLDVLASVAPLSSAPQPGHARHAPHVLTSADTKRSAHQ